MEGYSKNTKTLYCSTIDQRHQFNNVCMHFFAEEVQGKAGRASIYQSNGVDGYWLQFGYENGAISETHHASLDEAKAQAEFEYTGIEATWQATDS